ncbi:AKT-interacting protein-like [Acanthaster planci]|uniref:AKT-interacting protein-like n=1 Tax=Acanthaster planci TaxID=133434 RepID=A0A8B7YFG1_ACAPL|nr:AKT-interacting protein-like [Acanthaster planci]XP_022091969.1 AKT-interacting protein-like [Acanthaster planci]
MASDVHVHPSQAGATTEAEAQLIVRRHPASAAKKQLPRVPTEEEAAEAAGPSRPASGIERSGSLSSSSAERASSATSPSNGTTAAYGQFYLEYALMAEYNQLHKQKLPGVYVIPSAKSPLHWFGVLFIRQGLYQEGIFKFDLLIPENYPDGDSPRLIFRPSIFHPIIDPVSGELDVQRAFTKWKRNVNHIWQVLLYARRVFYKIDTKAPLNPEAAVLYEEDLDLFKSKVNETVEMCKSRKYDPPYSEDPHAIHFSEWDDEKHGTAKTAIMTPKPPKTTGESGGHKNAQTSGLSWVKPGTLQVFSKD